MLTKKEKDLMERAASRLLGQRGLNVHSVRDAFPQLIIDDIFLGDRSWKVVLSYPHAGSIADHYVLVFARVTEKDGRETEKVNISAFGYNLELPYNPITQSMKEVAASTSK